MSGLSVLERAVCPICATPSERCDREGAHFLRCPECGISFRRQILRRDPGEAWEAGYWAAQQQRQYYLARRDAFVAIGRIITARAKGPARLLDVGCGPGVFLDVMTDLGWECVGIDASRTAVEIANSRRRVHAYVAHLTDGPDLGRFRVVSFFAVLRHLPDPLDALRRAHDRLEDGGWCVIREANALLRARARRRADLDPERIGRHYMQEWTQDSISRTLLRAGFKKVAVLPSPVFLDGEARLPVRLSKRFVYRVADAVCRLTGRVYSPTLLVLARR